MGAFMLVRLAAIDAAGLLDETFFMYGEDIDWAYRIKQHGWSGRLRSDGTSTPSQRRNDATSVVSNDRRVLSSDVVISSQALR